MKQKLRIFQHPDVKRIAWTCDWIADDGSSARHAQGGTTYEAIEEASRQFLTWKTRAEAFKLASAAAKRHWENFHEVEEDPLDRPSGEPAQVLQGYSPNSYWGGKLGVVFWRPNSPDRVEAAGPFKTKTDAQVFGRRIAPRRYFVTAIYNPDSYIEQLARLEREEGLREERRLRRIGGA